MIDLTAVPGFPRMVRVRQRFPVSAELDPAVEVRRGFEETQVLSALRPRARVAVAVGSRGITHHAALVRAVVEVCRTAGHQPFVLPAMGSHGGATPEGQLQILAEAGITPERLGVPFEAVMDTSVIGTTGDGVEVHCANAACGADAVVLLNRVKPHTDFGGAVGSGLLKMAVVGVGKHAGARVFHCAAQRLGYERALRTMARVGLAASPILCGIAVVEDARHGVARVEVIRASRLEAEEGRLAAEAARLMPRLPCEEIDLLIVDRMGKDISGTGMDPNVIGRPIHGYSLVESEMPRHPRIRRIFVRDLTIASHGNATGIGMADFTTQRLVEAMDPRATYANALTALSLQGSKIPMYFATDREAIAAALGTLGLADAAQARVVRIADTLSVEDLMVAEVLIRDLAGREDLEVLGSPAEMAFSPEGDLR